MGLAYDPNEILKIPNTKRELLGETKDKILGKSSDSGNDESAPPKVHVAMNLEAEAKAPRERRFRLPNQQVQFITYLMDKYDDDYKAMAKDRKNHYQLTWRQIRAKINTFKGVPEQYAEYLLQKGEIVLDNPTPLAETRKKIAEENVKKFCTPKPKKAKPVKTGWIEESVEDMDFDTDDKLEDIETLNSTVKNSEKKLQLFSDDESDADGKKNKSEVNSKTQKNVKNGKAKIIKNKIQSKRIQRTTEKANKKAKTLEKSQSSDSESEEELEGEDNAEGGFVDLSDLSDTELSEDDILDNGEFVTDSDDTSE